MNRLRADALLLLVSVIWGAAFVAQKFGNESMPPLWFVGLRFLLSAIFVALPAFFEARKPGPPLARGTIGIALAVGGSLAVGACLQQVAMVSASATNGGFLTALYVVLVPVSTWILARTRVRPIVIIAGLIAVAGAYLLSAHGHLQTWTIGDVILVFSDFGWAFSISLVAIFLKYTDRPFFLAFVQFAVTAVIALAAALMMEGPLPQGFGAALPALLYTSILSGGVAFTLQIFAQRYTPAPEAALIMSLESVFAAVTGAVVLGERVTLLGAVGCAMIFAAAIISEIGPLIGGRGQSRAQ